MNQLQSQSHYSIIQPLCQMWRWPTRHTLFPEVQHSQEDGLYNNRGVYLQGSKNDGAEKDLRVAKADITKKTDRSNVQRCKQKETNDKRHTLKDPEQQPLKGKTHFTSRKSCSHKQYKPPIMKEQTLL